MLQVVWVYIWMISKHLMLLFNVPDFKSFIWMFPFQNISCYCLTNTLLRSIFIANISKHLMLLFNIGVKLNHILLWAISKHLMLLFNTFTRSEPFFVNIFQNISCYCLTGNNDHDRELFLISKHLMLLFNALLPSDGLLANLFQNISCYCLTQRDRY